MIQTYLNRVFFTPIIFSAFCSSAAANKTDTSTDSIRQQVLSEIVVTGSASNRRVATSRLGVENLELSKLALTPVLFGEKDIVKSITLLPGVTSEGEGAGGFEVRGGTASQNLMMLDGISLYNPSHVMGIFSTFNEDALSKATLYKGPIPSCYGGASSAVLESNLDTGDAELYHGSVTVGLLAAKIKASGPIVKEKLSFAITARRSYVDVFLKAVPKYRDIVMNFYDITSKFRYNPSAGNYIDLSFFAARDNMAIDDVMGMYWGNVGGSVSWLSQKGSTWHFNTTASITSYSATMDMRLMKSSQELHEFIRNYSFNERITYRFDTNHTIEFGLRSELLSVKSGEMSVNDNIEKEVRSGWQNALWAEYNGQYGSHINLNAGIRLSAFSIITGRKFNTIVSSDIIPDLESKTYVTPEPRVSLKYSINPLHSIKAGFSLTTQNIHAVRSSTTSFPFDRVALTSAFVKPEITSQTSVGYIGTDKNGDIEWSVESYYKKLRNIYDYCDGQTMFADIILENIILGGQGKSYGVEFMIRKNLGRFSGWIAYTLSKTLTYIDGINDSKWYDASNDKRHVVSIAAIYRLSDSWNLSSTWQYSSGHPLTIPDAKYELDGGTCYYYSSRNAYRSPSTHHLDISATYTHVGAKMTYQWAFGIYNLYNRYNPYIIFFQDDKTKPSGTRAVQRSLYGIVPSVSYTLKF